MGRVFTGQIVPCEVCGKPMRLNAAAVGHRHHCSKACYGQSKVSTPEGFWVRLAHQPNGCWLWTGAAATNRYGRLKYERRYTYAHRLAWTLTNGPIPDGMNVLHNCPSGDNPMCCNPAHLFLGDHIDNMADMRRKGRSSLGKPRPNARVLRGESHPLASLTNTQAEEIRRLYEAGRVSQQELAELYSVSSMTISRVVSGHRYTSTLTRPDLTAH